MPANKSRLPNMSAGDITAITRSVVASNASTASKNKKIGGSGSGLGIMSISSASALSVGMIASKKQIAPGIAKDIVNLVANVITIIRFVVSTLAGSGLSVPPIANGLTEPTFNAQRGVAIDSAGNLYVADTLNHRIRKISPTGNVTTLAGSNSGYADGGATAATFSSPQGIAVDSAGNVYVADTSNHRIRKISPAGVVSTLAGSGTQGSVDGAGTVAQFSSPRGVAVDSAGNVYVVDTNHRIRKISPAGDVTTFAGGNSGFTNGAGTAAQFNSPQGVAVDSAGNLYVADTNNYRIRKISPAGDVTTFAGSSNGAADGGATVAQFSSPQGVAVDSAGNVYVADTNNHRIRKITIDNNGVGTVTTLAGSSNGFANGPGTDAQFSTPQGVVVDSAGNVYVGDSNNHRIRKITIDNDGVGTVTTLAGSNSGFANGPGTVAQFSIPYGVALDSAGNLYVADSNNHIIRKIVL